MTLQQKLDQMKERMAEKFTADDPCCEGRIHHENTYEAGFTAAAQLLLPLVEALESAGQHHQGAHSAIGIKIREALSTLERRLSEGGK